jgi:hypothetical protein
VIWSVRIGDMDGNTYTLVSADMDGLTCTECGRVARACLGLSEALCDRCCERNLKIGAVRAEVYSLPTVKE